jgi:hypothetical protein
MRECAAGFSLVCSGPQRRSEDRCISVELVGPSILVTTRKRFYWKCNEERFEEADSVTNSSKVGKYFLMEFRVTLRIRLCSGFNEERGGPNGKVSTKEADPFFLRAKRR